jgi:fermentation-respiration switch protein FrsA (DUF1100 family)
LVVMGHGLGAVREMGLAEYAERFAAAGIAALVFTYRHFGDSGGQPRQLLDIGRQLEDWAAALAYARSLEGVDRERVAIWGSSFAGGHVIEVAARDQGVAAVVSQCPFTDGIASLRAMDPRTAAKASALATADELSRFLRRGPVSISLTGKPGSAALMAAPDSEPGYRALIPADFDFDDRVAARIAARLPLYRPGRRAAEVTAPILFCVCDNDTIAPADAALRYAAQAPNAEVKRYPTGHFDIYKGEWFERAVADQTSYLAAHLQSSSS